jgi:hypothetical protein
MCDEADLTADIIELGRQYASVNIFPTTLRAEWTPQLTSLLDIPRRDLPMIWNADFMLGPPGTNGTDSYVLGEINVSAVFPIPAEASAEIARRVADGLRSKL